MTKPVGQPAQIAIIGSAIAGLSAALAVAHAGHRAVIFGAVPSHLAGALQLAPNGYNALADLDALEPIRPLITRLDAIEIRSARTNSTLSTIHHDTPHYRDYGAIGRGTLVSALHQLAQAHPHITFHDEIVESLIATADETSLTTSTKQRLSFDLIIGADGANGLARRMIAGATGHKQAARLALRANCPASALPRAFATKRTQLWLGDGYHLVSYPFYDRQSDCEMINLVLCVPDAKAEASVLAARTLAPLPVLSLLTQAPITWHSTALPPASQMPTWRKNGLVLIGDGAHFMPPHLAQGAGQTLEDAAYLRSALTGADDVVKAASHWALSRQRALAPIIQKAEATGSIMRLKGPFAKLRNAAVEFGGPHLLEKWLRQVWQ